MYDLLEKSWGIPQDWCFEMFKEPTFSKSQSTSLRHAGLSKHEKRFGTSPF